MAGRLADEVAVVTRGPRHGLAVDGGIVPPGAAGRESR